MPTCFGQPAARNSAVITQNFTKYFSMKETVVHVKVADRVYMYYSVAFKVPVCTFGWLSQLLAAREPDSIPNPICHIPVTFVF